MIYSIKQGKFNYIDGKPYETSIAKTMSGSQFTQLGRVCIAIYEER